MITKTGIEYSENSDLSNSSTIEENGTVNSITIPSWTPGTDLYCQAYVIEDGVRINSSIEHYGSPLGYFQLNNEYAGANTITLTTSTAGSPTVGTYATSVEYSKDGENWTSISLSVGSNQIYLEEGESVYLRNDNGYWNNYEEPFSVYYRTVITASQDFSVHGNIKALLDYTSNASLSNGCFSYLFQNATTLTNTPDLYETTLSDYCYDRMFAGCTSLTTIPSNLLPATTLADCCYQGMFEHCTSLTTIPSNLLPATTLEDVCYGGMFAHCTSLTTVPSNMLPATTLADSCYYNMFYDCTSLTTTPTFPAITTAPDGSFENMFADCTSLTTAPVLPATTLGEGCYRGMFYHCTSLTTIPSNMLPATTLEENCYNSMFNNCTSLTTVPSNMLPATTLADGCYTLMFRRARIIKGPDLPATNLIGLTNCYSEMYRNCRSINELSVYVNKPSDTDSNVSQNTNLMFDSVTTTGTLHNLGSAPNSDWSSIVPSGWTVVNS